MSQFALKTRLPRYLRVEQERVVKVAEEYGLDCFPVIFEMTTYDQMNELASFGGFPTRYPHWRFGMEYERMSKSSEYGLSRIYEMVINNNPSYAYLLEGNSLTDQRLVMAHVYGHVDFFKNNFCFRATDLDKLGGLIDPSKRDASYDPNRRWIDKMANHGSRVSRHIARHGIDKVESFVDHCLSLENLIDPWAPFKGKRKAKTEEEEEKPVEVPRLAAKDYMENYINPRSYIEAQKKKLEAERDQQKKFPPEPWRDVLEFLIEHAPLERWERDVLSVVRTEAYYFIPQMQTKVMNEGWACLAKDSLVFTDAGIIEMGALVSGGAKVVSDGENRRGVYDRNVIKNHATVSVVTRRGLRLQGSENHRVMLPDGSWSRLDALALGNKVRISGGADLWASEEVALDWRETTRMGLAEVALASGVSAHTVWRARSGARTRRPLDAEALNAYESEENQRIPLSRNRRREIRVPETVGRELGSLLGYLVGDGHISRKKRHFGLTTGDQEQAVTFADLVDQLFGVMTTIKLDGNRWRVLAHSETASDFLVEACGLTHGPSAREKTIPRIVLQSPADVVRHFIRALFDCDGYAGKQGVILSTASEKLGEQVQLVLLNFGILSRRRHQRKDDCWHVHIAGESVRTFAARIGFGLARKKEEVEKYLLGHHWFKPERWDDEIVSIERGRADVYDISVEETHRYAAQGFINHNSYWHSKIMTEKILTAAEIVDYADRNAGVMATSPGSFNPYKIGVELYRHIEERWNKGQFGREWEECERLDYKRSWDMQLGLGREKIFQVRGLYNDVTFIDEFLTPDFVAAQKLYTFGYSGKSGQYEIESRQFKAVKDKLLFQLTNFGNPIIDVVDANFANRGELLLKHDHQGIDLQKDYSEAALTALERCWKRPVAIATKLDKKDVLLRYDGSDHSEQAYKV
jgi:stage V sporulation protein R